MTPDSYDTRRDGRPPAYSAIVLAGGAATRFGSDKTRYEVGGVALLDRVLRAVADAYDLLVVGERRATAVPVTWLREDPPGSGPANAVVAALPRVRAPRVVLLAGDLPFVDASTVRRLLAAGGDGGVLTDADGRRQYLCSAVRTDALVSAAGGTDWAGHSMRALLAPLDLRPCGARGREAHDVDTPEDVPSDP